MKVTTILVLFFLSAASAIDLKLLAQDEIVKFIELRKDLFDGYSSVRDDQSLLSQILISGDLDPIYALRAGKEDISVTRVFNSSEITRVESSSENFETPAQRSSYIWTKTNQSGKQTQFVSQITNDIDISNGTGTTKAIQGLTLTAQITVTKLNGRQSDLESPVNDEYALIEEANELLENFAGFGEFFQASSIIEAIANSTIVKFDSARYDIQNYGDQKYEDQKYEKDMKSSGIVLVLGDARKIIIGRVLVEGREHTPNGHFRPLDSKSTIFLTVLHRQ